MISGGTREGIWRIFWYVWRCCLSRGSASCPDRATTAAPSAQGAAGLRASLPAPRVGRRDVSFKFVIASRSESLRSRILDPLALRRIG